MEAKGLSKYPVKFLQTLRGGTAHLILFSDGKKYVVKWNGTEKKRAKEAVNEYVIGRLAMLLSLPVAPVEIVYIPEDFIKRNPELHSKRYKFSSGYQYACLFIENSVVLGKVLKALPSKREVENHDKLAAMAVFDQWVHNTDRTKSNLLLERLSEGKYYFHMIDHGKCFPGGYKWSKKTLREKPKYDKKYREPYQWIFSIIHQGEFTSYIEKIISFPNESIYEVIQSIPKEWEISKEDRDALYHFLVEHKSHLPKVIEKFMDKYMNSGKRRKGKKK